MLTETGTLPIGIEYDGSVHRDYEIREEIVGDGIEIFDDPETAERAEKNKAYMGICILAKQIVKIGKIPAEAITPEMLLRCNVPDVSELQQAVQRLEEKRRSYRDAG